MVPEIRSDFVLVSAGRAVRRSYGKTEFTLYEI